MSSASSASRVWLIRHGESEANAGAPSADPARIPLTARGRDQARAVAEWFHVSQSQAPPTLIVTSKYARTRETAEPTLARFPSAKHEQWDDTHEFTYLSLTQCANTTAPERRPLVDAYWDRADPHHLDGDGAESFVALIARIQTVLARLHSRSHSHDDARIAVFTHGQWMRALVWAVLSNAPAVPSVSIPGAVSLMKQFRALDGSFPIDNAAIIELRLERDANGAQRTFVGGLTNGAMDTTRTE